MNTTDTKTTATRTGDTITINLYDGTQIIRRGKTAAAQTHVLVRRWSWSEQANVNVSKSEKGMAKWMNESADDEDLTHLELVTITEIA